MLVRGKKLKARPTGGTLPKALSSKTGGNPPVLQGKQVQKPTGGNPPVGEVTEVRTSLTLG